MFHRDEEPVVYEEGKTTYTKRELEILADQFLREDSRSEICRECGERGEKTGYVEHTVQSVNDDASTQGPSPTGTPPRALEFPEFACANSHKWYQGEGAVRGIGGEDPILFEEHFQSRKRREIYTSLGTPDPSIVVGMYNRTHPQGRKVNSEEQRKRNGASFFR